MRRLARHLTALPLCLLPALAPPRPASATPAPLPPMAEQPARKAGAGGERAPRPALPRTGSEEARLARLVDEFYAEYAARYPTDATDLGLHQQDDALEDLSPAGLIARGEWLRAWDVRFGALDPAALPLRSAQDLRLVRHGLSRRLFSLNRMRDHHRRPMIYLGLATSTIYALIKRDFAPLPERLRAVLARQAKIPALLQSGKANLDQVPRAALDIALDELPGITAFFRDDVPQAFATIQDPALRAELSQRTGVVLAALSAFGDHLRREVAPRALPSFALGEPLFREKLHWDLWIDEPLPSLLQRGEIELARLQAEFRATAARIDAARSPAEVQLTLQKDHPVAARVISETQERLGAQRRFLIEHDIVSIPSKILPQVKETPPFMRATSLASMETPGPFEPRAREAFYNVTLPAPTWSPEQAEDFLRGAFNRPLIEVVSIHEAFPGHYVQFLWKPQVTKVRKFEDYSVNSEGWAHYTEQMMLDEGYGGGDPRVRLMQLQDALLRAARYVAAIRMHAPQGGAPPMTMAQAAEFFQREGLQTRKVSEMEARRGTQDPMYLSYTYGKLEILRLREAYRRKLGSAFSLRRFHDAFLAEGAVPLPLLREALLGRSSEQPPGQG